MSFSRSGFVLENSVVDEKISNVYNLGKSKIGEGSYGSVCRGIHKKTGEVRAIKTISKSRLVFLPRFRQEISIMKELEHPNIVRLYETFEDNENIYLVMELCSGGELFDQIIKAGFFSEREAAVAVKQMLNAVFYLHTHKICHRDLKPENFLLSAPSIDSELKLIDFGLSSRIPETSVPMTTKSGTPYYVAPEVLGGRYNEKCDLWSIGVLAYVLLCGYAPFNGANDKEILLRVKGGRYTFPPSEWNGVSAQGKDFIKKLLEFDPSKRMSASEALEHAWIKQLPSDTTKIDPSSQTRILSGLKNFQGISKLKKIALTAIAHQLHDSEISELRRSFAALDANGDGTLTIAELKQGLDKSGIILPVDFNLLVTEIDSDGSGSIDYMEFIAATMDQKLYNQRDVCWRAFKMFDRDNSGKISVSEFLKILNSPEEDAAKFFDKETIKQMMEEFDANKDGEIDFEEFVNMVTTTTK